MNPKAYYAIFEEITLRGVIFQSQICASDMIPLELFSILDDLQIGMSSVIHPQFRLASTLLAKARFSLCALESGSDVY
jgi:hypothetical protein